MFLTVPLGLASSSIQIFGNTSYIWIETPNFLLPFSLMSQYSELKPTQREARSELPRWESVPVENYFIFSFICPQDYFLIIINIMKPTTRMNRVGLKANK